jgi:hypothetical protein
VLRDVLKLDAGDKPAEQPSAAAEAARELAEIDQLSDTEVDAMLEAELANLDELLEGRPR